MGTSVKIDRPVEQIYGPVIKDLLQQAVKDESDKILEIAVDHLRTRLAKEVSAIAIKLLEHVRMELHGTELVIRIEMPKKEE